LADLDRSVLYTRERDDQFDWDVRGGVVGHEAVRRAAAERMLADLEAAPERYVAGALPSLPFASDSADLALCSHLLFTYADRLDAADHVAAIVEMARVASEVRIYPLVDHWGTPQPELVRTVIDRKSTRLNSSHVSISYAVILLPPFFSLLPYPSLFRSCPSPRTPRTWPCAPICCSPTPTGSTRPITSPRSSRWPAWPPRSASTRWSTTGARPSPSSSAR